MNYKLLFPTYRNRYCFIRKKLEQYGRQRPFKRALNLGTGEGDYDPMIAGHCEQLLACDINEADIEFARRMNAHLSEVEYRVEDALDLSFPAGYFDLVVSVDVMEHVGQPRRMTEEVARVLKTGGMAMLTFPQSYFPWTYDPLNYWLGRRAVAQGAYAFGHEYLIDPAAFRTWAGEYGLEVLEETNLSGYLVGALEMYWTGLVQRMFKANAKNISREEGKKIGLRPSAKEPLLAQLTDAINAIDHFFFKNVKHSVGKGFVVRKTAQ